MCMYRFGHRNRNRLEKILIKLFHLCLPSKTTAHYSAQLNRSIGDKTGTKFKGDERLPERQIDSRIAKLERPEYRDSI